jgi:four helix bundle protein
MNDEEWTETVPEVIKGDSLWKMTAYRLALFLGDLAWRDTAKLVRNRRMIGVSSQLYRSSGSISANLAEGYSRGTGKDRARFYEYALGSARESRDWYFKARHILSEAVFEHRLQLLTRVIQLILTMIPQQRGRVLRERPGIYQVACDYDKVSEALDSLLQHVPLPDFDDV